jgi:hypothetical protein
MRALFLVLLAGCDLYFPPSSSRQHGLNDPDAPAAPAPDAATLDDPACWQLGCAPGEHTEAQCEPPGSGGCVHHCHCACVPDTACSALDCGSAATCVQTCTRECQSMPEVCQQACVANASTPACETATTESDCLALGAACSPVYRGVGCTCVELACDCQNDHGAFARCEPAAN